MRAPSLTACTLIMSRHPVVVWKGNHPNHLALAQTGTQLTPNATHPTRLLSGPTSLQWAYEVGDLAATAAQAAKAVLAAFPLLPPGTPLSRGRRFVMPVANERDKLSWEEEVVRLTMLTYLLTYLLLALLTYLLTYSLTCFGGAGDRRRAITTSQVCLLGRATLCKPTANGMRWLHECS